MKSRRLFAALLAGLVAGFISIAYAEGVPQAAYAWQRPVTNAVQSVYGLDGPVARIAALVQVESSWDPQAESIYAQGLTQFTPSTAAWLAQKYPMLRPADPFNAHWSLLATAKYTKHILDRIQPFEHPIDACDLWAFDLSAYNGGPSWLQRDRMLTRTMGDDADAWFGHVEKYSNRAQWAFEENRAYPGKILKHWEHLYLSAGWPGSAACSQSS